MLANSSGFNKFIMHQRLMSESATEVRIIHSSELMTGNNQTIAV
ncbi:hypothetical protein IMPERIA89_50079 [Imperialibacter sp. 89]|nr:hypothetical protein IMPERIA89_50079 [Imperialibacter sp. 89]